MNLSKGRSLDYFWLGWLVLMGILVPLAFVKMEAKQWDEDFIGLIAVNENLKFMVMLWCAIPGVCLYCYRASLGASFWSVPKGVGMPLSMLLFSCVFSTGFSVDPQRGWLTALEVVFVPVAILLVVSSLNWKETRLFQLFLGWLPAAALVGYAGVAQFFFPNSWAQSFPRYGLGSLFYSPNLAAEYLVLLVPLFLILPFQAFRIWNKEKVQTWILAVICSSGILTILGFIILSKARASWVGLLAGFVLSVLLFLWIGIQNRKLEGVSRLVKSVMIAGSLVVFSFFVILLSSPHWAKGEGDDLPGPTPPLEANRFIEEFNSIFQGNDNGRFGIWKDTWAMIQEETGFFGLGAGQFRIHYPKYYDHSIGLFLEAFEGPRQFKQTRRAHNDYLQIWAEFGLIGLIGWVWLAGRILWGAGRSLSLALQEMNLDRVFYLLVLIAGFLTFLVIMGLDFPSRMPATITIGWIIMGLILGLEKREKAPSPIPEKARNYLLAAGFLMAFVCGKTGWIIWVGDHYRVQASQAYLRNDWKLAERYAKIANKYLPWDEDNWFLLYNVYRINHRLHEALELIQDHLQINPWYYPTMSNEMNCLRLLKRYDQSRESARRILETFPQIPDADWYREYIGDNE